MEKFSLKWNDFSTNVHKSFQNLRKEEDFFDITIVGDDCKHVTAHKLVLASSSEYFRMIFSNNKKYFQSNAMICLDGLNQNDLNNVLDYIYHGEIQIYQHDMDRFLGIAERLKLKGLIGGKQQKDEDDGQVKTEHFVVENTQHKTSVMTINESQGKDPFRTTEKPVISAQSLNIQSLEELDQKVEESYSKDSSGSYVCHFCATSIKYPSHMKVHVEKHFEGLEFPCTHCDSILRNRHSLRTHYQQKHRGDMPLIYTNAGMCGKMGK